MTRICFVFIFMLFSLQGFSQAFIWHDPIPISDSLFDNANACMYAGSSMNWDVQEYSYPTLVVWEHHDDSNTTSIWARDVVYLDDPFVVLSEPGVYFRNPQRIPMNDMLVNMVYETNLNGNWDIYGMLMWEDSTSYDPWPVCSTPEDEINVHWSNLVLSWQCNDAIYIGFYNPAPFPLPEEVTTIDSGNCSNPSNTDQYCAWLREYNGYNTVWRAK